MMKFKNFLWGTLAMLTALLMVGCDEKDNPVSTSLRMDTSTLVLSVGQSARRTARSAADDAKFTYTSSAPSVATVDQSGKVTAFTVGNAEIKVEMAPIGEYAASTLQYTVKVNPAASAAALKDVDKTTPLTLVAAEDGKITVYFNGGITLANDIKYTVNGGDEQTIAKNTEGSYDIVVKKGDTVQLYSENTSLGGGGGAAARGMTRAIESDAKFINIRPSMKTEIFGNVMSLLKGKDNLDSEAAETIEAPNAFYGLFSGADKLVTNEERNLVLPATELSEGCYENMFSGCKGIEKAPELPADKCEKNCYKGMFSDCSKITSVKILATQQAEGDVDGIMDNAGTEAETAPVLVLDENADVEYYKNAIPNVKIAIAVSKITLEPITPLTLKVGETATLKATIEPEDAADKNVEWSSSNKSVAIINPDGLSERLEAIVTAVSAGTTTITVCTPDGSVSADIKVTVEALPEPDDTTKYHKVYVYGEDSDLEPPFSPSAWDDAAMRFSNLYGKNFRYLTDDEYFGLKTLIIDVSDATDDCTMRVMNGWWAPVYADNVPVTNGQMKIQITEEMANDCAKDLVLMLVGGSCTINSVYYEQEGEEPTQTVLANSITLSQPETLYYNDRRSNKFSMNGWAKPLILPDNTTRKYVKWTISNPSVAVVSVNGSISPISEGVATVTATTADGSNLSAQCEVKVKLLGRIWYEIKQVNKNTGSNPFINPLSQEGSGITGVTYRSSDESKAKVDPTTGEVTIAEGATSGKVVITATATVDDEVQYYYYSEDDKSASYELNLEPATGEAEMEDFKPESW